MRRPAALLALLALMLCLLAPPAAAHDYWLEFRPLAPQPGGEVALSMWVGEDFAAHEQKGMQLDRTLSLRHITRERDEDLRSRSREGATPIARVAVKEAGGHLLAVERAPARISLRALKFNRYLKHEGLRAAWNERKQSGERLQRGRERYTRYLKAFVQVGADRDGQSTRVLGHRIELVPARDLAGAKVGEALTVEVRFDGKPQPGVLVEAFGRDERGKARGQKQRTGADGRARFTLDRSGAWLLRTVHMQRCIGCEDAQWESFWTSYSFAVN